jgi:YesN/AraC family two-component response regulator
MKSTNSKILIIDDNKIVREGIKILLKDQECDVLIDDCESGIDGLTLTRTRTYDFLIVDYSMPEIDGIETIKLFREYFPESNTKIILISMDDFVTKKEEIKKIGIANFIKKDDLYFELPKLIKSYQKFDSKN